MEDYSLEEASRKFTEWYDRKQKEYETKKAWLIERRAALEFDASLEDVGYAFADVVRVWDESGKEVFRDNFLDEDECDAFLLEVFGYDRKDARDKSNVC